MIIWFCFDVVSLLAYECNSSEINGKCCEFWELWLWITSSGAIYKNNLG